MNEAPIFHYHVKKQRKRRDGRGQWFVYMLEPNGDGCWMTSESEPVIGEEQILYVLKKDTSVWKKFEILVAQKAERKILEDFIRNTALQYKVWCEKTWDEAREEFLARTLSI